MRGFLFYKNFYITIKSLAKCEALDCVKGEFLLYSTLNSR